MLRVGDPIDCYLGKIFLRALFNRHRKASFSLQFSLVHSLPKKFLLKASSSVLSPSHQLKPSFLERYFGSSSVLCTVSDKDDDRGKEESSKEPDNGRLRKFVTGLFVGSIVATVIMSAFTNMWQTRYTNQLTVHDFLTYIVPSGQIEQIIIAGNNVARVIMKPGPLENLPFNDCGYNMFRPGVGWQKVYVLTAMDAKRLEADIRAVETSLGRSPEQWAPVAVIDTSIEGFLDLLLLLLLALMLFRASKSLPSMKNSFQDVLGLKMKLNIIKPNDTNAQKIRFKDVAGLHEAKIEIKEFVDYLKRPEKYMKLGARLPKGVLLTGPPGCGKTFLAKALAAESSVPFISMNGTEFVEMIGGLGASRIRNLFKTAKKIAPCIIYIDEIDAIGRKRSQSEAASGGSREEEQTLNQLLVEMDGIDSGRGIVLLGSTNRGDILDKALLRPGRFDRHIVIDLPTALERQEMFELYLSKIKLDHEPQYYSKRLAQRTPRFSGADIANVVNEAAIRAASSKRIWSRKRSRSMVEEEREIVAYHESGHALIGWLLEHTDALLRVSIIPRTSVKLGFAQYSPRERKILTKEEMFDRMCMLLGGRAAENIIFGHVTTGAEDDLKKPLSFPIMDDSKRSELGIYKKPFSMKLQHLIDQEVSKLVAKAYFTAENILKMNEEKLRKLAVLLLEKETLSYEDVIRLIGPPKFPKQVVELADHVLPSVEESYYYCYEMDITVVWQKHAKSCNFVLRQMRHDDISSSLGGDCYDVTRRYRLLPYNWDANYHAHIPFCLCTQKAFLHQLMKRNLLNKIDLQERSGGPAQDAA
ncbi:Paraplegin [Dirofilaria immitis]|nr:Paraplegin [Dirofilaria immitis]